MQCASNELASSQRRVEGGGGLNWISPPPQAALTPTITGRMTTYATRVVLLVLVFKLLLPTNLPPFIVDRMVSVESLFSDRCQHLVLILSWSWLFRFLEKPPLKHWIVEHVRNDLTTTLCIAPVSIWFHHLV